MSHFDETGKYIPNYMDRVVGFTIHFKDWIEAGRPFRSPEEVAELFNTHCNPPGQPCELYDPKGRAIPLVGRLGVCKGCGCHVSDDATELDNAIAYPTKACWLNKFAAVVDQPIDEKGQDGKA